MGRRRNTRRLEDRTYRYTAKEREHKPLQTLERDNTIVHHQQSIQQSDPKPNIYTALDPMLRKEEAAFRKGRSCGEHIFTLRQSLEQCQKWKTPCYVNFIDFDTAFDSIHRESIWCILRHYGIPCKIGTIIKMLYEGFKSKVICGQNLTEEFDIKTGVKQGGILSTFLCCLPIDWIVKRTDIGVKSRDHMDIHRMNRKHRHCR